MENTRVKKIVILVAALLALTIIGLQLGLSNFMQAFAEPNEDVKVEYSAQVNNDKTEAQIQINATPKVPEVEITSIELPNGEVVNDTTATYQATENGKLTFTIHYKLPNASSEQPFTKQEPDYEEKQQTTTYEVKGIKPVAEQEEQTPAQSSPSSTTEGSPSSAPENNPGSNTDYSSSTPDSSKESTTESNANSAPALQQHPPTNGPLQQNNLGDTPTAYTQVNAFTFDSTTGTITDYNQAIGGTAVNIPPTMNGKTVKAIGNNAFENKGLTSVTLPEGLQTIGGSAFTNNQLSSVKILSATNIGEYAFQYNQISTLELPQNLQTIGICAFENNKLTDVTIPPNVTNIDYRAFQNNQISTLALPQNVVTIGSWAFSANQLTSVTFPQNANLTSIGDHAFQNNQIKILELPQNLQTIGNNAFYNNRLTSVQLPQTSLTSIGDYAFASYGVGYNQITFLTIPNSVTHIGGFILDRNSIIGAYYKWNAANSNYQVNLKEQIPGFHPQDYKIPTSWTGDSPFQNITNYSYDNQTGIFSFSAVNPGSALFGLWVNLDSHVQEGAGQEENKSIIQFNGFQPTLNTVTLNLQEGHFTETSVPLHFEVVNGKTIDPSIAENMAVEKVAYKDEKYKLKGWYTDPLFSPESKFDINHTPVTGDITLYANWEWTQAIQNPSVMVAIDPNATLTDYYTPEQGLMAKASIHISLVPTTADDKFKPTQNVVIKTSPNPIMERVNHIDTTPKLHLQVLKPDGQLYTNSNDALMKLNYFASSGNPTSATYTVQAPLNTSMPIGEYTSTMTYEISLE